MVYIFSLCLRVVHVFCSIPPSVADSRGRFHGTGLLACGGVRQHRFREIICPRTSLARYCYSFPTGRRRARASPPQTRGPAEPRGLSTLNSKQHASASLPSHSLSCSLPCPALRYSIPPFSSFLTPSTLPSLPAHSSSLPPHPHPPSSWQWCRKRANRWGLGTCPYFFPLLHASRPPSLLPSTFPRPCLPPSPRPRLIAWSVYYSGSSRQQKQPEH